ncbi:MAG: biotin/lipoyl-binding protein, partial [Deltaproteobacteria bacterium]|nr:biotin/lipoyl-binding protein [Deltaproteobacteria bacterium]
AALEAGADAIDLSLAPASGGTCQTDVATMWHALRGTDFDLGVDIDKVLEAEKVFKECMADYFLPPEATQVEPLIPWSPMPGGALTANTQMLRDNGLMDRYPEIIAAMKEVVERGGYGTSVTPVSQFYFQQAFNNVLHGKWEKIAPGYGKMVLGYFGKTPVEPDAEIVKLAAKQMELEPTTKTVLELNDADKTKGLAVAKADLEKEGLPTTPENLFIAATCKEKGIMYLKGEAKVNVRKNAKAASAGGGSAANGYTVTVGGKKYAVKLDGNKATVNGKSYDIAVAEGADAAAPAAGGGAGAEVKAPLPGLILDIKVSVGDAVAEGDILLVMEAMKMESPVKAPAAGTVASINVGKGDQVTAGQLLVTLN